MYEETIFRLSDCSSVSSCLRPFTNYPTCDVSYSSKHSSAYVFTGVLQFANVVSLCQYMDLLRRSLNFGQAMDLDAMIVFFVLLSNLLDAFRSNGFVLQNILYTPLFVWLTDLIICVKVVISWSLHLRVLEEVRRLMQHTPHHTAGYRHLVRNCEVGAMRAMIALAVVATIPISIAPLLFYLGLRTYMLSFHTHSYVLTGASLSLFISAIRGFYLILMPFVRRKKREENKGENNSRLLYGEYFWLWVVDFIFSALYWVYLLRFSCPYMPLEVNDQHRGFAGLLVADLVRLFYVFSLYRVLDARFEDRAQYLTGAQRLQKSVRARYALTLGFFIYSVSHIPTQLPFPEMDAFLTFFFCFVLLATLWWYIYGRTDGPRDDDLEDWIIAGIMVHLVRMETWKGWVEYSAGWMVAVLSSIGPLGLIAFVPRPRESIFHTRSSSDNNYSFQLTFSILYALTLAFYALFGIFFMLRPLLKIRVYSSRWFLKLAGVCRPVAFHLSVTYYVFSMWILLYSIECGQDIALLSYNDEDKVLGSGNTTVTTSVVGIECTHSGWYRVTYHLTFVCLTWVHILLVVSYASDELFWQVPRLTRSPKVHVARTCASALAVVIILAHAHPLLSHCIGLVVSSLGAFMVWIHPPTVVCPIENVIEFSLLVCIAARYAVTTLDAIASIGSESANVLAQVLVPLTGVTAGALFSKRLWGQKIDAGYASSANRFGSIDEDLFSTLGSRDLGIFFHVELFLNKWIWPCLEPLNEEEPPSMKDIRIRNVALRALARGLSTNCGHRSPHTQKIFERISPLLYTPLTLEAAVRVLYPMSFMPEFAQSIRAHHLEHLITIWSSPKYTKIHRQVAHILRRIRGKDSLILYTTTGTGSPPITPLHDQLLTGVVRFTLARHDAWCVPIDVGLDAVQVFTSCDPIDAIITFPPILGFPKNILPRRCAGLTLAAALMETQVDLTSLLRPEREGEWELDRPTYNDSTATHIQEKMEHMKPLWEDCIDTGGKVSRLWALGTIEDCLSDDIKDANQKFAEKLSSYFLKSIHQFKPCSTAELGPIGPSLVPPNLVGMESKSLLII